MGYSFVFIVITLFTSINDENSYVSYYDAVSLKGLKIKYLFLFPILQLDTFFLIHDALVIQKNININDDIQFI